MTDLINTVSMLMELFFPGFAFMYVYNALFRKNMNNDFIILWSLLISRIIEAAYAVIHKYVLFWRVFTVSEKILIFIATGIISPILIYSIMHTVSFRNVMSKLSHRTINSDIFDDLISLKEGNSIRVHIKNSKRIYVGTFSLKSTKCENRYISLIDYTIIDEETKVCEKKPEYPSTIVIGFDDIESLEIFYHNDSDVWNWLSK